MATATQTSPATQVSNPRTRLAVTSLVSAVCVVVGLAVALGVLPGLWQQRVSPSLTAFGPAVDAGLQLLAQLVVAAGAIWLAGTLPGANPPRGIRGGITLAVSALIATFFVVRAVGIKLADADVPAALPITLAVAVALLFGVYQLLTAAKPQTWMQAIDEQGVLHTFNYKATQGVRMRRYTLIGLLLIAWSGVYAMYSHDTIRPGDLRLRIPFTDKITGATADYATTVLPDAPLTVPLLLGVLALWLAWRAVNMPAFADFLIATDAEMNKVSWPSRRGLFQDTIVVLVTTVVLTAFLLFVDVFWGWLLSREGIGVLPNKAAPTAPVDPTRGKADW